MQGEYGGAGAAVGRGLKEEDLDFVSWEGGTVVRPHNDSSGVKWITSWRFEDFLKCGRDLERRSGRGKGEEEAIKM